MNYSFAKHETFHVRRGWLRKGLDAIDKNNHIFLETIPAMDELGIGKNMIKSLRYWMQVLGLTNEARNKKSQKVQEKNPLAEIILNNDKYFEADATFWLLHFNLAQQEEEATTWYWFFNHFNHLKFTKELFVDNLERYIKRSGNDIPARSSLESDFNILRRMYLYDPEEDIHPESSKVSPFRDLGLIVNAGNKEYEIRRPTLETLPPEILYYCILETLETNEDNEVNSINIETILNKENSVGKIFKLNMNKLYDYLEHLQDLDYLRLDRQAGLNSVKLKKKPEENKEILKEYYNSQHYNRESDNDARK
ncbi:MAG: DUF4007 family protein [Bacillota bacterium]